MATGSGGGFPPERGNPASRAADRNRHVNLYDLTDAELLDCLGPSWSAMTPVERHFYGPRRKAA